MGTQYLTQLDMGASLPSIEMGTQTTPFRILEPLDEPMKEDELYELSLPISESP